METVVKGGIVVTESGAFRADLAIRAGRIAGILAPDSAVPRDVALLDAEGLVVLPGGVDLHTHFTGSNDDPAEELREGTFGAALGGITTVVEMPHSDPPATTPEAFAWKRALMADCATVDHALWAGLDNRNLDQLAALDALGAIGFKAFLTSGDPSGAAPDEKGLPRADDGFLLAAMRRIRSFDGLIAIHAENHEVLAAARRALQAAGRRDVRAHAESGPEIAEVEAVTRVITFARDSGVRAHVVHVSSARAAALIDAARPDTRITLETCPHYLILDEEDLVRIGAEARCGPPLRPRATVDALWRPLLDGRIDALASDHCPYTPAAKAAGQDDIWLAGMGLSGIQTMGPMMFSTAVLDRGLPLTEFARLMATGPARIAGLYPRKGAIRIGADADLAFYDPAAHWTVRGAEFRGLGRWSAFEGMGCTGRVVMTMQRGRLVQRDGLRLLDPGAGRFLTRDRSDKEGASA